MCKYLVTKAAPSILVLLLRNEWSVTMQVASQPTDRPSVPPAWVSEWKTGSVQGSVVLGLLNQRYASELNLTLWPVVDGHL